MLCCVYHCMARCVRQAFLCGFDAASGKNFDHRKAWIENRLENLASIFAVEIASYAVMSNHLHLILRLRPDIGEAWTDQEFATRAARLSLCRFDNRELSEERLAADLEDGHDGRPTHDVDELIDARLRRGDHLE